MPQEKVTFLTEEKGLAWPLNNLTGVTQLPSWTQVSPLHPTSLGAHLRWTISFTGSSSSGPQATLSLEFPRVFVSQCTRTRSATSWSVHSYLEPSWAPYPIGALRQGTSTGAPQKPQLQHNQSGTLRDPIPAHPNPAHPLPAHPNPAHPNPAHPIPAHPIPAHPNPAQGMEPTCHPCASTATSPHKQPSSPRLPILVNDATHPHRSLQVILGSPLSHHIQLVNKTHGFHPLTFLDLSTSHC